jgi:acyl phosphate:glycerol-3-phosphate acyltransferase
LVYLIPRQTRYNARSEWLNMEMITTTLLALAAFVLASIPFSLIIGRWFLHEDIRDYGDGNPGAYNVFKAGGQKTGILAVILDVGKGVPFVFLAYSMFDISGPRLVLIAVSAIMGHAFSPFLRWHGGKAVAVTFGVLLALPQRELLLAFIVFMVIGFLFIEVDAWTVIFGAAGTLVYFAFTRGTTWETLLIFCILAVLAVKQFEALHTSPGFKGRLIRWLQTVVHVTLSII